MITIVGGGIFGLSIGWYLARAGRSVTLLERGKVGQGTTQASAGMVMPWKISASFNADLFELQRASCDRWSDFAAELNAKSDKPFEFRAIGRYFLMLDKKALKRVGKQYEFHRQIGFSLDWLSGDELREREPHASPEIQAAVFSPLSCQVDNQGLIEALRQAFLGAGGILREETSVLELLTNGNQVQGVRLEGETVPTKTVILTTGVWLDQLAGVPSMLHNIIQPIKGQILTLQMSETEPLIKRQMIGPIYLVPRHNGRLIVGTTIEEAGFNIQPTAGGMYHILRKAQLILPSIIDLPILEIRVGLRPTGPNRLPVMGKTDVDGLFFASGGHSHGVLLSPIVAEAMTELVMTGTPPPIISPFAIKEK
ncbi:glycine oxidase ThiO [Anaerolineales bacterium HSG24]|nr:glycine oxidase ThiO [Anaerolineales bacterium HSG24]